jgi:hypothetical protein
VDYGSILLVEDNGSDAEMTLRVLQRTMIANEVILARDGAPEDRSALNESLPR